MSVSKVLFYVVAVSIFLMAVVGIAAVWDFLKEDIAWRAFSTIAIIGGSAATVSFVGYMLGVKW